MNKEQVTTETSLGTEPVGKLLKKFAIPSIVAMLVGALYNIVDQIFIGQKIGELGNAATNITFPLTTICTALALMFGIGGAATFNLTMGVGDKKRASNYVGSAVSMLFITGIIFAIFTQIFVTPLLNFFGSPDNVMGYASTYTRITSIGFPFLIFSIGGGHLIRADGSPKYTMICNLTGAVINTILDPIFIFGLDMGMAGAALATIIGQAFSFLLVVEYLTRFKTVKITLRHLIPRWEFLKKIISLGTAPSFNQAAMMVVQVVMNKSLTHYGALSVYGESVPLASAGIINKVAMIFFAVIIGISQGMQPIVSYNYGARQTKRVKEAYILAIRSGFIISIIAFLLFQLIPKPIISIFGQGSEKYFDFAVSYFRIFMFFTFINFMQPISSNFFTAIGKPVKGIFISLTRQILFLLPLLVFFPLLIGIDGIMYAGPTADFMAAIISAFLVYREFRQYPFTETYKTKANGLRDRLR